MTPDPEQRLPRELLKELIEEGSDAFRGVLEKLLNTAMQMEREEFLGARRWERSEQRRDHANGYKAKTLSTRVGQLQIRIPQVRHLDFYPRSLERGCRSEKALKLAIAEMYVMGVSTRKVTEITEQLCGTEISASQVSRISKLLDDELEQFRNRPLGSYPVVYLDAHYEKVRRQGSIQDVAVLKATGVNCWGKREVIGVSCRLSEAEVHWREFLQQLQKRGLEGVQLIVSDDHSGLRAARRAVFPSVPWQRCQFHLSQNAQRFTPVPKTVSDRRIAAVGKADLSLVLKVFEVCIHLTQSQENVDALQIAKQPGGDMPGILILLLREDFQDRLAAVPVVLDHVIHAGGQIGDGRPVAGKNLQTFPAQGANPLQRVQKPVQKAVPAAVASAYIGSVLRQHMVARQKRIAIAQADRAASVPRGVKNVQVRTVHRQLLSLAQRFSVH